MKKILIPTLSVLALFAVASCGDDPDASGPPILMLSGSGWSPAAPASEMSSGEGMDEKMMWGFRQHFTAANDLPALDSDARSYTLQTGEVSSDTLDALASAFGVTSDFVAQEESMGGGYLIGNYDGKTATLYVGGDVSHYWNYSPAWDDSSVSARPCDYPVSPVPSDVPSSDDAVATDVVPTIEVCPDPVAPENVPNKDEAEALFVATMDQLSINADDLIIESYADEWGSSVTGYLKIDGVRTSVSWSFGYGANGAITWAGGSIPNIQDGASYPRIGTAAALERLNDQQSTMMGGGMARGGVAYESLVSSDVEAVATTDPGTTDQGTTDPSTTDPSTIDPASPEVVGVSPEVQEVSIVSVEEELVTLYGADGSIYLVPGYAFIAADDETGYAARYTVSAIPDEYMQVADAIDVAPGTDVPVVNTMPTPVEGSAGVAVDPTVAITQESADALIGMTEAAATKAAEGKGWGVRVGSREGIEMPLTMDFRTDRVTLTVKSDKVTAIVVG